MAKIVEELKSHDQGDMEAYLIGLFNNQAKIKKIDVRSYQGGWKIIVHTVDNESEESQQETK